MRRTAYLALIAGLVGFFIGHLSSSVRTAISAEEKSRDILGAMKFDISPLREDLQNISRSLEEIKTATKSVQQAISQLSQSTTQVVQKGTLLSDILSNLKEISRNTKPPLRWEYKFLPKRVELSANSLGRQGWELVATTTENWLLFKRPVREE